MPTDSLPFAPRVLDASPIASLDAYVEAGGGRGIAAATKLGPAGIIEELEASGLRGRGGAGFPTGTKWRTVADSASPTTPTTVVVNAAEGEPGTFKDRAILRANPYRVIEGALIAATAVGGDRVVMAIKASFDAERARIQDAIAAIEAAGWCPSIAMEVCAGPSEYLFGEETALLEVIDGRPPFPRVAPPFRHGIDEHETGAGEASAADVAMATTTGATSAPPTLVNNVETLANVPAILAEGPTWFRALGTGDSPGTVVVTISGATRRHGVTEVAMGTPLSEVIDSVGGGPEEGRQLVAALSGVANPLLPATSFATPLSHEAMISAGTGLGAAGFIVFDDAQDLIAVAEGVSRFLAVESCGQCTPCKQDGLALVELLGRARRGEADQAGPIADHLSTVADEARCYLATQHQLVGQSILAHCGDALRNRPPIEDPDQIAPAVLIAPILDIVDDRAVLDDRHAFKQPDWTFDEVYSGQSPADQT